MASSRAARVVRALGDRVAARPVVRDVPVVRMRLDDRHVLLGSDHSLAHTPLSRRGRRPDRSVRTRCPIRTATHTRTATVSGYLAQRVNHTHRFVDLAIAMAELPAATLVLDGRSQCSMSSSCRALGARYGSESHVDSSTAGRFGDTMPWNGRGVGGRALRPRPNVQNACRRPSRTGPQRALRLRPQQPARGLPARRTAVRRGPAPDRLALAVPGRMMCDRLR